MALIDSLPKIGNWLFKYRGIIPIFIFIFALPFYFFSRCCYNAGNSCSLTWNTIILITAIAITFLGFFIRCYTIGTTPHGTSGRNTKEQVAKQLNSEGIYSIVRHPLYLGNYLMWAGALIFTESISLFVIVSLIYWIYYERIMIAEENYLETQFGESYRNWSKTVPAFVPAFRKFKKGSIPFSFKSVLRREYSGAFAITLIYTVIDYGNSFLPAFASHQDLPEIIRPSLYILGIMLIIMLTLRTLKHHTKLLDREQGRD